MEIGKTRARAAVLGSFLADAATMPLHWIYDVQKLAGLLDGEGRSATPEFFPKPACPFYEYKLGALSPYGDEARATLQYGAEHAGGLDGPGLTQHLVTYFKAYTGRLNSASKHLVERWDAGDRYPAAAADDSQAHSIVKVPVLVARYGGTPELMARVEEAVRSHQNNDKAVAVGQAAAAILEQVAFQGKSVAEAVAWALQPGSAGVPAEVLSELAPFLAGVGTASPPTASLHDMVWEVTKVPHCQLPGAFVNSLYAAATSAGYAEAVRRNIAAGGDNCSRGIYSAALWAAAEGEGALPADWKAAMVPGLFAELEQLTDRMMSHRGD